MKTALTIAGSDSSGGAGTQADIKTMTANGVFAMSAITALTAQNTTGVTDIFETTPHFLAEQLDAVFTDIYPDAVKIGMVSSAELIGTIADKLQDFGVLVLGKPFTAVQFRQAVQIAASNYKRLAVLRAENAKLLDKIAQLRLVDRAKCYLIEKKGMTETEAHRLIEKGAMDTRRSRGEVAQELLEEEE